MRIFNEGSMITVGLDPSYILMCLQMWRDATDMKIPVHDEFKLHFMANRRQLLENHEKIATAWGMMLDSMKAEGAHQARLEGCREAVEQFKAWARAGLAELNDIAAQG